MIQHEDDLRNQRLGYLLTLNGLLFAGLAFAWKASHARSLVVVLAVMGMLIAWSARASMKLSDDAIAHLRKRDKSATDESIEWSDTMTDEQEIRSIPVALSSDLIAQKLRYARFQPWKALPVVFGLAWVAMLVLGSVFLSS